MENVLQHFPDVYTAVLEDASEDMQGMKRPALFLMIDLWEWCLGQLQSFSFGHIFFPGHATHVFFLFVFVLGSREG